MSSFWYAAAAWVQAIGTIAAVVGSAWLAASGTRAARRRAEEARMGAKTAALNLAIMAYRHVNEMQVLLRDETHRARLHHFSPSRTFLSHQQMLIGFPIESLEDSDAMVAFAFFPGGLALAADIYSRLEEAVRLAEGGDLAEVHAPYALQLALVEERLEVHLEQLRSALKLPDGVAAGQGAPPHARRRVAAQHDSAARPYVEGA
jgi:hypothetical protein